MISLDEEVSPVRLDVCGEIDLATAEQFCMAVAEAAARHPRLIVDLTEVDFLASAGVHALFRYRDQLAAVVVREGSVIARALALSGFSRLVSLHRTP
jgi:anti-anti-sigma factor